MKKGFTLVELVAVIIILGMIALIVTPLVNKVINSSKDKAYQQQIEEILRSAERWAMSNSHLLPQEDQAIFYLSIPSLKDDGFVKDKDIINPVTGDKINGCILLTYQADSLQYDYAYEEGACSSTHIVDNLTNVYPEYVCYTFDPLTGTITSYDAVNPICVKNVYVPNKIDGVNVLIIGTDAFRNKGITSVTLPKSLVTIGDYAFAENNLVTLKLTDLSNLTVIGQYAFDNNAITSINLTGLTSLDLINLGAFSNNNLASLNLNGLNNLRNIQDEAFAYNSLTTLNISGLTKLEQIHADAFTYNTLTSVTIENLPALYDIESGSFAYNQITNLELRNLPQLNYIYNSVFPDNNLTSIDLTGLPQLQYIGYAAFKNNFITSLDLSSLVNLESIGEEAFEYNPITSLNLTGLTKLTTIDFEAFKDCALTSLNLTGLTSLNTIGQGSFEYNVLTSLNLTGLTNLTTISTRAFYRNRLTSVTIPASVTTIGENAFYQGGSYPWSSVTIGFDGTNLRTRFNTNWTLTGWPTELMPAS